MSDINDIIKKLAQQEFNRIAQEVASTWGTQTDASKTRGLMLKMVGDLKSQLGTPSPLSSDTNANLELKVDAFKSLDALIRFAAANKLNYDGERIAYAPGEIPPTDDGMLLYNTRFETRDENNQPKREDISVNKSILSDFIKYLQAKARKDANRVMQVMIGKITDEFNAQASALGSSNDNIAKPDHSIVDGMNTPAVDVASSEVDGIYPENLPTEPIKLKLADIGSKEAFVAWLNNNKIQVKSGDKFLNFLDPNADKCKLINIFYKRALSAQKKATNTGDKTAIQNTTYYIKQIQTIGQQFTDKSGNPCSVSSYTESSPTTPVDSKKEQDNKSNSNSGSTTENDAAVANLFSRLKGNFPLQPDGIYFDKITAFISDLRPTGLVAKSQAASQLITYIAEAKNKYSGGSAVQPLNITLSQLQSQIGRYSQPYNAAAYYISRLENIVDATAELIYQFRATYLKGKPIKGSQDLLEEVNAQIGDGNSSSADPSSIQYANLESLRRIKSNL